MMVWRLFRHRSSRGAGAVRNTSAVPGVVVISDDSKRTAIDPGQLSLSGAPANGHDLTRAPLVKLLTELPPYTRVLYDELKLKDDLRHQMAPLLLRDDGTKKRFAVVVLEDMVYSDELREMVDTLDATYQRSTPLIYPATPNVLSSLFRDPGQSRVASRGLDFAQAGATAGDLWGNFMHIGKFAYRHEASDLHVTLLNEGRSKVEFCIDGVLVAPPDFTYPTSLLRATMAAAFQQGKGGSQGDYSETLAQQVAIHTTIDNVPLVFRWASMTEIAGQNIVMRMLKQSNSAAEIPTFEKRGFLPDQCKMLEMAIKATGGVMIAGPVGGGKSATCATAMATHPSTMNRMTLEDPVENILEGVHHFPFSRPLGESKENPFLIGMQQIKRMNPHVVHSSEVRDYWSALFFRDLAGSSLRVTSTVHAPSAAGIPDRLSDAELQIPRSVLGTPDFINLYAFQILVPRTCECALTGTKTHGVLGLDYLRRLNAMKLDVDSIRLRNPEGCPLCRRGNVRELNGAKGRIVVASMFVPDDQCLKYIRKAKNLELRRYVQSWKNAELNEIGTVGKTAFEVAMYHVHQGTVDPREVESRLGAIETYCAVNKIPLTPLKLVEAETA